ncbi:Cytochrome P450 [Glarea lozoyensis ATCC 20868]|uniref:Cytochrome P450 n=1 Tax=Glarea lozoyensis (strain ATCC 20868 / MF5171) TaxID=1116229 RepID=S3CDL9_GLAL2|nr:Cytochrome P450 [Glarea lozoyensis ATCC 20868]EPE24115.1 Cytochrome P450 [Glarea lozoyensis ATCC 20868]
MIAYAWAPFDNVFFGCGILFGGIAVFLLLLTAWFNSILPSFPEPPSGLDVPTSFSPISRWVWGKKWLLQGRNLLIKAHAPRQSYMLPTPKNYCVFISNEQNIKEFASNPDFSLNQAYDDLFSYKHNKLYHDQQESALINQQYYFRVLREGLTTKLAGLYPYMYETLVKEMDGHISRKSEVNGWKSIHYYPFLEYVTVSMIGPIFWGQPLWDVPEFQDAARRFPAQYFKFGEIVQHVPKITIPLVKYAVTGGNKYRNVLIKHLLPIIRKQLSEEAKQEKTGDESPFCDIMQDAIRMVRGKAYWTPERVILLLESLWRAGGHSVPMTIAHIVNSLCEHPEYFEPLREELQQHQDMDFKTLESLPLANSFMKEVIRTRPLDSASTRRKAMKTHTFQNGPHVPAGNIVCIPSLSIMNDASIYPNPQVFDGFRFVTANDAGMVNESPDMKGMSKVTDVNLKFPFWGYGKEACPGRFFASIEMKIVMAILVSRYDFKLAKPETPTSWSWRTIAVPRRDSVLLIRERSGE